MWYSCQLRSWLPLEIFARRRQKKPCSRETYRKFGTNHGDTSVITPRTTTDISQMDRLILAASITSLVKSSPVSGQRSASSRILLRLVMLIS